MDMCGQLLARVFAGFGIQKVLTAQTGGLPPAHAVSCHPSLVAILFTDGSHFVLLAFPLSCEFGAV